MGSRVVVLCDREAASTLRSGAALAVSWLKRRTRRRPADDDFDFAWMSSSRVLSVEGFALDSYCRWMIT